MAEDEDGAQAPTRCAHRKSVPLITLPAVTKRLGRDEVKPSDWDPLGALPDHGYTDCWKGGGFFAPAKSLGRPRMGPR